MVTKVRKVVLAEKALNLLLCFDLLLYSINNTF